MAVIRKWSGDGLASRSLTTGSVGTGDTTFSSINGGGTFSVTTDGTRSPQITWPSSAAAHQVRWNALGDLNSWAVRRYFSVAAVPAQAWSLLMGHTSTGADLFRVEINSSGYLRYRSASAAVYSPSTNAIEPSTVYRIELTGQASGASTIALYAGDSTTALLQSSVTVTAGNLDEIRFGHVSSVAVDGETGDDFAIADVATFIGPVVNGGSNPTTLSRKWQGDGLSAGSLTTASAGPGDTAFTTVLGSLTIENAGNRTPRILLPNAAAVKRVHWWPLDSAPLTAYAVRWYQTFGGYSASEIVIAQGLIGGGSDKWTVRLSASGNLRLRDDANATIPWTSGVALPLNQSIRFEVVVNGSDVTLAAYRGDTSMTLASTTTTLTSSGIDELRFGTLSAIATNAVTYDDIAFKSEAIAIGPAATPGHVYTHYRWNGTVWVPQDVYLL